MQHPVPRYQQLYFLFVFTTLLAWTLHCATTLHHGLHDPPRRPSCLSCLCCPCPDWRLLHRRGHLYLSLSSSLFLPRLASHLYVSFCHHHHHVNIGLPTPPPLPTLLLLNRGGAPISITIIRIRIRIWGCCSRLPCRRSAPVAGTVSPSPSLSSSSEPGAAAPPPVCSTQTLQVNLHIALATAPRAGVPYSVVLVVREADS